MKRILGTVLSGIVISIFFTGCNSMILSVDSNSFEEFPWEIMETADGMPEAMPDYYEENEKNKYQTQTGLQAFQIAEGHSSEELDLSGFQIGTLIGSSFVYGYETRIEGTGDNRNKVHCVAAYDYKSREFQIIHENVFVSINEDEESFYLQISGSSENPDIFVYDNGMAYLYDASGILQFHADVETFVRTHFGKAFSVVTTDAMTDGQDRIYIELVVEKEEIVVEEDSEEEISEEEADEEAEKLDQEFEEKTVELVLVYDFEKTGANCLEQERENFNLQVLTWKNMTAGKSYETVPDAEADMKRVQEVVPDQWGTAVFYYLDKSKAYRWKGDKKFTYTDDDYICTFTPKKSEYDGWKDIKENSELDHVFTLYNERYYETTGKTDTFWDSERELISRDYTYVWYETETDQDGNSREVEHSEERTQYMLWSRKRRCNVVSSWFEGYWTLKSAGITGLVGVVDDRMVCMKGDSLYWLLQDGSQASMGITMSEDCLFDISQNEDGINLILACEDYNYVIGLKEVEGNYVASDFRYIFDEVILQALAKQQVKKSSVGQNYLDAYDSLHTSSMGELASKVAGESLTSEKVLRAQVRMSDKTIQEQLQELISLGADPGYSDMKGTGFFLTTQNNGLVYYEAVSLNNHKALVLDDGTWYQSWKQDGKYISVGFAADSASYGTLDVAFARVYEYDLNELFEKALHDIQLSYLNTSEPVSETETTAQNELVEEWEKNREKDQPIDISPIEEIHKEYFDS